MNQNIYLLTWQLAFILQVAIEGQDDSYDFGSGAGFYVDATTEKWKKHYNMYTYITKVFNAYL